MTEPEDINSCKLPEVVKETEMCQEPGEHKLVKKSIDGVTHVNGRFAKGHPLMGYRPKGRLNKFTEFKNEIMAAWKAGNGKERFLQLLRGNEKQYFKALDVIVAILPKDQKIDIEATLGPKIIIQYKERQDEVLRRDDEEGIHPQG